jgi:hypothetical protein
MGAPGLSPTKRSAPARTLEARYPDVPLDRTRTEDHVLLATEAVRQLLRAREADPIRRPAGNRLRDQEQRGP